jgi:hypothetical protein
MRTLRRSILAIATKTIARIKAILEYGSVPSIHTNDKKSKKIMEAAFHSLFSSFSTSFSHATFSFKK